ncbi:transcriptional regulator [Niastella yeongjuensis]|uniref:Transcriptional regulator n=1 Tax=Niastella yeongjuensis TaxID=354355 RepID=A0A1V9EES5_9BACT|nr:helix-turn-helix domain-containing protein [Niastella yeongjuensis]OQP44425.1 transcriptional regulator [Niastella yeongjuensis]SEO88105.1 Helix-turn-helix domain-containing protein [Niastella yeongjuensis]
MESLESFYQHKFNRYPPNLHHTIGQFGVFRIEDRMSNDQSLPLHVRRNFFKIMLFTGDNQFRYNKEIIPVTGNTLLFFHPHEPYSYEELIPGTSGYFCVFRSEFFQEQLRIDLDQLPLFRSVAKPVFPLSPESYPEVESLFEKMLRENQGDYIYKYELIRNYVSELFYLAMKMTPPENLFQPVDAGKRLTLLFLDLLEQQFPIETPADLFLLRTPGDFADKLFVHVNHLNRAIKKTTGRTTSQHIFDRLLAEAKVLLKHTDWSISDISRVLGFDDGAHFNKFLRKHAGVGPTAFRAV